MILIVFIILIGMSIASFIGSLSYRMPKGISILKPASFCPYCKKRIKPYDLIPVISYLILRGKCRYCKEKIPLRYLLIEISLPLAYVGIYIAFGLNQLFFIYSYLSGVLFYLSLLDVEVGNICEIDIIMVYPSAFYLLYLSIKGKSPCSTNQYIYGLIMGVSLVAISYIIVFLIKRQVPMGMGDLFIIPGIALHFTGIEVIRILIFSSVSGVFLGTLLILLGKVKRETRFPMIPYITFGVIIELLLF